MVDNDLLIIEALLSPRLLKKAEEGSIIPEIINAAENYFKAHIDKNNTAESIFNLITPAICWGFSPVLGLFVQFAESYLGLNPSGMVMYVVDKVKDAFKSGIKISENQIDQWSEQAAAANYGAPPTQEDLEKIKKVSFSLREAKILKLGILEINERMMIQKKAGILSILDLFAFKRKGASALVRIISWIIKTFLRTAGLTVGKDIFNGLIGHKDAPIPGAYNSSPNESAIPVKVKSTQTLFKPNPSYQDEILNIGMGWVEMTPPSNIGVEIAEWAKDIYPDLKTSMITSDPDFQKVVELIQEYNSSNTTKATFMPKRYTSRKKVVDLFIDSIAKRSSSFEPQEEPSKENPKLPLTPEQKKKLGPA